MEKEGWNRSMSVLGYQWMLFSPIYVGKYPPLVRSLRYHQIYIVASLGLTFIVKNTYFLHHWLPCNSKRKGLLKFPEIESRTSSVASPAC